MISHDPTYPLFPIASFLSFLLALVPLSWHAQAWNSGTCAFMIWTAVANLNLFINSLIWKGNIRNPAPVWCDISAKLYIGVSLGIPAAILCISRRLYCLLSLQANSLTRADKRKMIIIDLCIALGIPVIGMVLHYVIQGHRFDILEDIGCYPSVYNVTLAYPLYLMWAPLLALVSLVYSALTLRSFYLRRTQFAKLVSSTSGMSVSRYLRLMALACVDITFNLPLGILVIWIGGRGMGPDPWISWDNTHYGFSRVDKFPAKLWRLDSMYEASIELTRWLPVFCSILFFGLFGFAEEARKNYRQAFWKVAGIAGIKPRPASPKVPKSLLPSWVKPMKLGSRASITPSALGTEKGFSSPSKVSSVSTTSSATTTEVELYSYGIKKNLNHSSSTFPPPPRYRPAPPHIPMDVSLTQTDFSGSPTSMTTTFADQSTLRGSETSPRRNGTSVLWAGSPSSSAGTEYLSMFSQDFEYEPTSPVSRSPSGCHQPARP